jgi:hypothetical protein
VKPLLPNKATASVRLLILDCLREERYRIHADGQRYLNVKGIKTQYVIEDLIEDLDLYHLFEVPPQSTVQTKMKYQYVICYTVPEVSVHIKISPTDDDPPTLYLGFHSHNTGYAPLPQIPIKPKKS